MVPQETSSFCFPSSPDVSLDFFSGNIGTLGKTKLTVSLRTIQYVYIVIGWGFHGSQNNQGWGRVSNQSRCPRLITIAESHFDLSVFVWIYEINHIPPITSHKQVISKSTCQADKNGLPLRNKGMFWWTFKFSVVHFKSWYLQMPVLFLNGIDPWILLRQHNVGYFWKEKLVCLSLI